MSSLSSLLWETGARLGFGKRPEKFVRSSLENLCVVWLCWNLAVGALWVRGGQEIVEIMISTYSQIRTASKLEMSNRDNSAADCPISLKFGMRAHALRTLGARDQSRERLGRGKCGTGKCGTNDVRFEGPKCSTGKCGTGNAGLKIAGLENVGPWIQM